MLSAAPAVEDARFKVECYMAKLETLGIEKSAVFNQAQAKLKAALR